MLDIEAKSSSSTNGSTVRLEGDLCLSLEWNRRVVQKDAHFAIGVALVALVLTKQLKPSQAIEPQHVERNSAAK